MAYDGLQELYDELKSMSATASLTLDEIKYAEDTLRAEIRNIREQLCKKLAGLGDSQPNHHHLQLTDEEGLLEKSTKEELLSNLLKSQSKMMELMGQISKKNSTMYSYLEKIYEHDAEISLKLVNDAENLFMECYNLIDWHEKNLSIIQTSISLLQKQTSSFRDVLLHPVIFVIREQLFHQLRGYISGDMRAMNEESWSIFYEVLEHVTIYQLKHMLSAQPLSDITIIACSEQDQFVYWKVNKDHLPMLSGANIWSEYMGPVLNQLDHDICWAIVSAELVSVVRHILGRDTQFTGYSAQELVDFTNPKLRSETRLLKPKHFCYTCDVQEALEYVGEKGIERAEARPLQRECVKHVRQQNFSNRGYIGGVETLRTVEDTFKVLQRHPVATSIPIFEPEYTNIKNKIYRGATSRISRYMSMHAVNITGYGEENGEKYLWVRSSHGANLGVDGYLKVSVQVMMMCLTIGKYGPFMEHPFPLLTSFVYPTLLSREEEERKKEEDHSLSFR